jgi:hypothetical protein
VFAIHGQPSLERARPAKPLKPRRDLGVIQIRIIAAARADKLVDFEVGVLGLAVHDADQLAPQDRPAAVTGLTSEGGNGVQTWPGRWPRIGAFLRLRYGDLESKRSGADKGVKAAHSAHHQRQ